MIDPERYRLLNGPYVPPICRVGDKLPCEHKGREVVVGGMTDAPIQWPYARATGTPGPILCGDLIRAVRSESAIAVAWHWAVSPGTVRRWRRALGVPELNEGSRRLLRAYVPEKLTPEARALGKEAMHSPAVRAKISAVKAGKPAHPDTASRLRQAGRRPRTESWKRKISLKLKAAWARSEEHGWGPRHHWTEEEIALLGTESDAGVARRLGLSKVIVMNIRRRLGIPAFQQRWTELEIAMLGTATDDEVARRLRKPLRAVREKRERLGVPAFPS